MGSLYMYNNEVNNNSIKFKNTQWNSGRVLERNIAEFFEIQHDFLVILYNWKVVKIKIILEMDRPSYSISWIWGPPHQNLPAIIVLRLWNCYLKEITMFWQIKNKYLYILFTNISNVCFVYIRCITCRLNKPYHSGDETDTLSFS